VTRDAEISADLLDPARAAALHATLSRSGPPPQAGDPLPPFWHQIYFWSARPPEELGKDGHIRNGTGLIPDLGLPQRMWAGGRLEFHRPLIAGTPATKVSTLESVTEKQGRSGPLGFVTLRHEFRQNDRTCVVEEQDLVYKPYPTAANEPRVQTARTDETALAKQVFSTTLLFRYSALTFNGHRIHYDLDHARETEGYPGLVVHGPLLAQLLMHLAEDQLGALRRFTFRAIAPLMHFETAELCWNAGQLWVRAPDGRLCMEASARQVPLA